MTVSISGCFSTFACIQFKHYIADARSSRAALYFTRSDVLMYFTICTIVERIYFGLESHTPLDAKNTIPVAVWF